MDYLPLDVGALANLANNLGSLQELAALSRTMGMGVGNGGGPAGPPGHSNNMGNMGGGGAFSFDLSPFAQALKPFMKEASEEAVEMGFEALETRLRTAASFEPRITALEDPLGAFFSRLR